MKEKKAKELLKLKAQAAKQAKKDAADHKAAEAKLRAQQAKIKSLLKSKKLEEVQNAK